jgi:hypothetical protein
MVFVSFTCDGTGMLLGCFPARPGIAAGTRKNAG